MTLIKKHLDLAAIVTPGKTGQFDILADGVPTPVGDNFWHVRCGYCPPTRGSKPRGILLCGSCAAELGFPAMK